jgi:hypothetical protein
MRGRAGDLIEALNVLLERTDARIPTRARARALTVTCHLLNHFGDDPAIPSLAGEAHRIARDLAEDAPPGQPLCKRPRCLDTAENRQQREPHQDAPQRDVKLAPPNRADVSPVTFVSDPRATRHYARDLRSRAPSGPNATQPKLIMS